MSGLFAAVDRFPVSAALLVTVAWSSSWILIKVGLADIPPLTFAGLRYTLGAAILLVLVVSTRVNRAAVRSLTWRTRGALVIFGVVGFALTQGAQFVGLAMLPAATLSLLFSLTPIVAAFASGWWLGEWPRRVQLIGVAAALVGAICYLAPDVRLTSGVGLLVGVVALASNVGAVLLGRAVNRSRQLPALIVTALSMAVGGVLLLATGVATEPAPRLSPQSVLILVWLVVVNTATAFTVWNHTQRHLGATESAAVNTTMLVQVALLGWIFLGEALGPWQWAGIVLVTVGVFRVQQPGQSSVLMGGAAGRRRAQ